jgi:signal peptide peptidase SppA
MMPKLKGDVAPFGTAPQQENDVRIESGVAVLPVTGTLVKRHHGLSAESGLTSYGDIADQFDRLMADPSVKAILLDVDSPGGEAGGVFDLADRIFAVRDKKPVWAIANDDALSAAYAIASAATKLYLTRTGSVGSIGVIAMHLDQSQADKEAGLKYTPVFAGAHKNDFSTHQPLSDPAKENIQQEVDRIYALFASSVARNRNMPEESVRATEARIVTGDEALRIGLADRIGTQQAALEELRALVLAPVSFPANPNRSTNHLRKEKRMEQNKQPEMEAAPPATPAPDIAAIEAKAKQEAMAYVTEVNDLCLLAGMPDKAAQFVAKATPVADVRKALIEAKAAQDEATAIANQAPANSTTAAEPKIDTAAIYAARNKKGN